MRLARCFVRVNTITRSSAVSASRSSSRRRLPSRVGEHHALLDRDRRSSSAASLPRAWDCAAGSCGELRHVRPAWSPRTGATGAAWAACATILRTSRMKPMSSMRSASSSTKCVDLVEAHMRAAARDRADGPAWRRECRRPSRSALTCVRLARRRRGSRQCAKCRWRP